jgi:hypothetical protein
MVVAQRVPGWIKGPLWLAVFFVGVWTFLALMREAQTALDFLIPRLEHAWRWMAERADKSQRAWKIAALLCAAVIVAITLYRAWPIWHFKATSSLREDEIISIVKYTSRGFVPASAPTVLIERSFPKEMSIWISGNDRTLLQWNLSSRAKPERGPLDYEALGNGRLVAVESFLHPSDEQQRFG